MGTGTETGGRGKRAFDSDRKDRYLRVLADTGSAKRAAEAVGVAPEVVAKARRCGPVFAREHDAVVELLRERLGEMLIASALGALDEEERATFDPVLALKLYAGRPAPSRSRREASTGRRAAAEPMATQAEVDAELRRRLLAMPVSGPASGAFTGEVTVPVRGRRS